MKNECNMLSNWSDSYLNTLETLYGPFNLHPTRSIADLSEEWKDCFRTDGQLQIELQRNQPLKEWSAFYLDSLETLYKRFNLYPNLTTQELCDIWQECFMSGSNNQTVTSL